VRETDGQTDGRTNRIAIAITALCIASNAGRAVKIVLDLVDVDSREIMSVYLHLCQVKL